MKRPLIIINQFNNLLLREVWRVNYVRAVIVAFAFFLVFFN